MTDKPTFETLDVRDEGAVCRIKINREKQMNALSVQVLEDLHAVIFGVVSPDARVVIIEGAGDKAFVAGADIEEMQKMSPTEARDFARLGQMITKALETLTQVTVAKVQGYALGGGCEIAMACDIIVCGKNAKFGQPEVNLGLIPGFGGTQRLVRRVGLPVAMDMLLSGRARSLSGTEAHQLGLVSRVVDDDKLEDEIKKVIRGLLSAGPKAIAETKRLAREAYGMSLDAGLAAEASAFGACFADTEAEEGLNAFLEKRTPAFAN